MYPSPTRIDCFCTHSRRKLPIKSDLSQTVLFVMHWFNFTLTTQAAYLLSIVIQEFEQDRFSTY